jgi:predicted GNAT family acetyltransferase
VSTENAQSTEVSVIDDADRCRFEARVGDELAGVLTYIREDGVAVYPHTKVQERFEGRGIGGRLAKAALDDARERGLKVDPACPFVEAYVHKNPEYADLLVTRSAQDRP